MSKKHITPAQRAGKDCLNPKHPYNYWQSADFNSLLFQSYHNVIVNLALSRFEWLNLPETCDARFLEVALINNGAATICHSAKTGCWYSTQVAPDGKINVYDNPTKWNSFGNGGWYISCTPKNAVMIWDNMARTPMIGLLDYFARELTDIAITKRLNRQHQKMPFIFAGSQDQGMDMLNLFKQIDGGEPAVLATDTINSIKPEVFNTGVPFLGDKLDAAEINVWQRIYTFLGIENMPFKAERQIEDEVNSVQMPVTMMKLSPLTVRREACDKLNRRFEPFLSNPIDVVWRTDNRSENHELQTSIKEQLEYQNGGE